jgi:hypothetical protein
MKDLVVVMMMMTGAQGKDKGGSKFSFFLFPSPLKDIKFSDKFFFFTFPPNYDRNERWKGWWLQFPYQKLPTRGLPMPLKVRVMK